MGLIPGQETKIPHAMGYAPPPKKNTRAWSWISGATQAYWGKESDQTPDLPDLVFLRSHPKSTGSTIRFCTRLLYTTCSLKLSSKCHISIIIIAPNSIVRASQVVLVIKNLSASAGDLRESVSIPRLGRSPGRGHGNTPDSCLENPMDRGAWQAI